MVDPTQLTASITTALQSIAGLVTALGGDTKRIFPYKRSQSVSCLTLMDAIWQQPIPSIMVVWEGTIPGNLSKREVWSHKYALYLRFKESLNADAAAGAYTLWQNIINGVPVPSTDPTNNLKMLWYEVHQSCYPMRDPSILPQSGQTADSKGVFEYWKVGLTFMEKGDF